MVQGDHRLWPVVVTEPGFVREEHSIVCSVAPLPLEVRHLQQRPLHTSTRDAAQKDHLCGVVVVRWLSDVPFELLGNTLQRRGLLQKGILTKPATQRRHPSSFAQNGTKMRKIALLRLPEIMLAHMSDCKGCSRPYARTSTTRLNIESWSWNTCSRDFGCTTALLRQINERRTYGALRGSISVQQMRPRIGEQDAHICTWRT